LGVFVAESVELATILLTDLVGSTRLATSVGPTRADELREEHFALLREAVAAHGGREAKNTGDGLMVAFVSASAAVGCAVLMQQLFERRYRDEETGLHIRIGLAAGESTVTDGDYFGMPSIEAARLCAQAAPDGILASGAVKMLAGHTDGVGFEDAGSFELKGFPEPVQAFTVSWSPLAEEGADASAGAWPLPALLRSVPNLAYVGRTAERASLEGALTEARNQARRVVLLSGEPGIGKSRLASHSAHRAHAQGFAVLWGGCSEELAVPYEPWIEIATQIVEHAPEELLATHAQRHKGESSRLARNLASRIPDLPAPQSSDAETERYLLFSALAGLIAELAQQVPVCLVLDDLHWGDAQSVALLKHLARTVESAALLIIVTFRDSDLTKDHPLTAVLADLHRIEGTQRIALRGLGGEEVAEIVTAAAGHELDQDSAQLAGEIAAETDGNPFFVGEILRSLLEAGALVYDDATARWSVDRSTGVSLPESVREVIERRVDRLGEETKEILTLGAVIGRFFDLELLCAVAERPESELLDHLESAVAASLLAESDERVGEFRFAHTLVKQTLYESLGATRRARLHHRVGEALETLYGADPQDHLSELALHWKLAAVSVDRAKAADYATKAGRRALENLAPAEAVKYFADAVELSGDADTRERCEALIGLGEAQLQTGIAEFRETLLEAARIASGLGDTELAARAALANTRGWYSIAGAVDDERVSAIERALELDDPPNAPRRARLLALQAQELSFEPDFARRKALAEEAIELARGVGDLRALAEVLRGAFFALWSAKTLELRATLAKDLVRCADELGDPTLRFQAANVELHVCVEQGQLLRGQAALERMERIAAELQHPLRTWQTEFETAAFKVLRGDLLDAERFAERALQTGQEAGDPDAIFIYGAQLTFVRTHQGRADETIAMVEQSVASYPAVPAWRAGLAATLCWLDRREEAATIIKQAASDRFEHVKASSADLSALLSYAEAAVQTSDSDAAAILHDLIEPFSDQVDWNGANGYGHARLYLGLLAEVLGDHAGAEEHLAFACEFHEASDMPLWAARGHLGWAEGLTARGEAIPAREHAERAIELSRKHGYGGFEKRAAALLAAQSAAEA
jgi:predicted ATPase/class 3 adenylate cyclase